MALLKCQCPYYVCYIRTYIGNGHATPSLRACTYIRGCVYIHDMSHVYGTIYGCIMRVVCVYVYMGR